MSIIDSLVEQSGNPKGIIGRIMLKIMNKIDSGLNNQIMSKLNYLESNGLEIGCGGGESIYRLLSEKKLAKITGIDLSKEALKVSSKKNLKFINNKKANFIKADVRSLPFSNEYFDIVYAVRSHYFWDDLEGGFKEIYRVMKPGGKMYIFSELFKIKYHMDDNNESISKLLNLIGFNNIKIENTRNTQCLCAVKK